MLAWTFYPTEPTPVRANPVIASIDSKQTIDSLFLEILDPLVPGKSTEISISGSAKGPVAMDEKLGVFVAVPDMLLLPTSTTVVCTPGCTHSTQFGQGSTFSRTLFALYPTWKKLSDGTETFQTMIQIPLVVLNDSGISKDELDIPSMRCSSTTCRGSVPLLVVSETTAVTQGAIAQVELGYLDLKKYDWQSGTTPYPGVDIGVGFNYPIGRELSTSLLPQFAADGSSAIAQQGVEFKTFLSGVFAALASALLLAAIQDLIAVVREQRHIRG